MNRAEALAIRRDRVKKARLLAGFTQAGLATAVTNMTGQKVTRQAIIHLEKGRSDLPTFQIEAIAELCGVSLDFLTGKSDTIELKRHTRPYVKPHRRDLELATAS